MFISPWNPYYPPRLLRDALAEMLSRRETYALEHFVQRIEKELQLYLGVEHAFLTPSGTFTIYSILKSLRNKGEVIIPSIICEVVPQAIIRAGHRPIVCDVDANTYNLDPEKAKERITQKTRAIIPAHMFGLPAEMYTFRDIAEKENILLIEDAAQALGATYKGKKVATLGDVGVISFNNKVIDAWGGGAIVLSRKDIYEDMRERIFTISENNWLKGLTRCYVLSHFPRIADLLGRFVGGKNKEPNREVSLSILTIFLIGKQLAYIDQIVKKRRMVANLYKKYLGDFNIVHPPEFEDVLSAYSLYTVQFETERIRETVRQQLARVGIGSFYYEPMYSYVSGYSYELLGNTNRVWNKLLCLPNNPYLTEKQISCVRDVVRRCCSRQSAVS